MGTFASNLVWTGHVLARETSKEGARAAIWNMAVETLNHLNKIHPQARAAIRKSAGYAVFDDFGSHIFFVSMARGKGVAVDNKTKKRTFMKMFSAGAGLVLGIKDYRVIFVFESKETLNTFIDSGWNASAQADAAAKTGEEGVAYSGAISVAPGVWVYQITEAGLALQATFQGTKYYKDDDLN
jgi:lipid-binding SYLF domain-containing protein